VREARNPHAAFEGAVIAHQARGGRHDIGGVRGKGGDLAGGVHAVELVYVARKLHTHQHALVQCSRSDHGIVCTEIVVAVQVQRGAGQSSSDGGDMAAVTNVTDNIFWAYGFSPDFWRNS
jgi:hypothetical protein